MMQERDVVFDEFMIRRRAAGMPDDLVIGLNEEIEKTGWPEYYKKMAEKQKNWIAP